MQEGNRSVWIRTTDGDGLCVQIGRNRIILRILALHVTIHGEGRRERREKPRKSRKSKRCAGKRDNNSYEVNI